MSTHKTSDFLASFKEDLLKTPASAPQLKIAQYAGFTEPDAPIGHVDDVVEAPAPNPVRELIKKVHQTTIASSTQEHNAKPSIQLNKQFEDDGLKTVNKKRATRSQSAKANGDKILPWRPGEVDENLRCVPKTVSLSKGLHAAVDRLVLKESIRLGRRVTYSEVLAVLVAASIKNVAVINDHVFDSPTAGEGLGVTLEDMTPNIPSIS